MAAALSPPTRWDYMRRPPNSLSSLDAASAAAAADGNEAYRPRSAQPSSAPRQAFASRAPLHPPSADTFDFSDDSQVEQSQDLRPYTADPGTASSRSYYRAVTSPDLRPENYSTSRGMINGEDGEEDTMDPYVAQPVMAYPPSRLAQYNTSIHVMANGSPQVRPPSSRSQHSGISGENRELNSAAGAGAGRNKLSAESWVKGGMDQDRNTASHMPRNLRRKSSKEVLRPAKLRLDSSSSMSSREQGSPLRPGQIIAKANSPSVPSPRTRLFLTDNGSAEDLGLPDEPPTIVEEYVQDAPVEPKSLRADVMADQLLVPRPRDVMRTPSPSAHAKRNSIVDSIPTRTSSLRQSSVSPNPESKKKKKSEKKVKQGSGIFNSPKKPIPDSKWEGLSEDDETVKRILQLRERRQSRMLETHRSTSVSPVPGHTISEESSGILIDAAGSVARGSFDSRVLSPLASTNASSEFLAVSNGMAISTPRGASVGKAGRQLATPELSPPLVRTPPPVESSSAQPISPDDSYHQAVAAIKTPTRPRGDERNNRTPSISNVNMSIDAIRPSLSNRPSIDARSIDASSVRSRARSFRWASGRQDSLRSPVPHGTPSGQDAKLNRRMSIVNGGTTRAQSDMASANDAADTLPRRDSTEVAVDEYLQSPRFARKVKHPQSGRVITFSELGDPEGAAVFVCIGMGLTRFISGFFDELASTLRLRLITIDRPGVGASQPYPSHDRPGPLGWPDDVLAICDNLNISKFSLLAHSAGAVYAFATALILPHMIVGKVHLLAPWIPPSQLEAISHSSASAVPAGALPRGQRFLRALPTPFFRAANASFISTTSASLKPASKRSSGAQARSEGPRLYEQAAANSEYQSRAPAANNPGHQRRESLLHMDQYKPADIGGTNGDSFPAPASEIADDGTSIRSAVRQGSLALARTSTSASDAAGGRRGSGGGLSFAPSPPVPAPTAADWAAFQRRQRYSRALTHRTWDLATKDSNPATDLLVCLERSRAVGFRYTDVHTDVVVTHGAEDKRVPVANVRWLAEQMNRRGGDSGGNADGAGARRDSGADARGLNGDCSPACELRVLAGEGHGLMASPRVMGDVLTEIAAYWYPSLNDDL